LQSTESKLLGSIHEKDAQLASLHDKYNALVKKHDKCKRVAEELKRIEENHTIVIQELKKAEDLVTVKREECEKLEAKLKIQADELAREKKKSQRVWTELEDATRLLKQTQSEKEQVIHDLKVLENITEDKYSHKITLLEKKCQYYQRLAVPDSQQQSSTLPTSTTGPANNATHTNNDSIAELMQMNEASNQSYHELQLKYIDMEKSAAAHREKTRQLEDMLAAEHKKKISSNTGSKNIDKRRLILLEKCIDEILLETHIANIAPSKLNPREKAVIIVKKLHDDASLVKKLELRIAEQEAQLNLQQSCKQVEEKMMLIGATTANSTSTKHPAEGIDSMKAEMQQIVAENEDLKKQLKQAKGACVIYKGLIKQFTQLHSDEQVTDTSIQSGEAK